jgi:hypothetical protein
MQAAEDEAAGIGIRAVGYAEHTADESAAGASVGTGGFPTVRSRWAAEHRSRETTSASFILAYYIATHTDRDLFDTSTPE